MPCFTCLRRPRSFLLFQTHATAKLLENPSWIVVNTSSLTPSLPQPEGATSRSSVEHLLNPTTNPLSRDAGFTSRRRSKLCLPASTSSSNGELGRSMIYCSDSHHQGYRRRTSPSPGHHFSSLDQDTYRRRTYLLLDSLPIVCS